MTYCIQCGKQNPDTAKFCTGCGAILIPSAKPVEKPPIATEVSYPVQTEGKAHNKSTWWIIGVIAFLGMGTGAYFLFFANKSGSKSSTSNTISDTNSVNPAANSGVNKGGGLKEAEVLSFLDDWLKSQNNKNMATYSTFYGQNFQGIKRVKSGQTFYYTHDEWIKDRTKMYNSARNLTMTISDVRISNNAGNSARVNFTHGYSSNSYNDIGEKQMQIEKSENGKICIVKEEMLSSFDEASENTEQELSYTNSDGKLVYKSDCFVIVTGSFSYETDARNDVLRMKNEGYSNAGYLWIPDYPSLSGKQFYAPFIGPFQTYEECQNSLRSLSKTGRFWYGKKVSYDNTQVEIR